jgi:hypothetical protein
VLFQAQYKWRVDKVTFCDRQNHYISRKCHSLYKKELFKLLLSGLDIVIISLDDLVFLISPNFYQRKGVIRGHILKITIDVAGTEIYFDSNRTIKVKIQIEAV